MLATLTGGATKKGLPEVFSSFSETFLQGLHCFMFSFLFLSKPLQFDMLRS